MTTLQQAEALRQQAIALLLAERSEIEEKLLQLGYGDIDEPATAPHRRNNCKHCGEPGHNTRRCPKRNTEEPASPPVAAQ